MPEEPTGTDTRGTQVKVVIATVLLVVVVAVVIVALTDGGGTATPDLAQQQPVEVVGDPLIPFSGDTMSDAAIGTVAPVIAGASFDGSSVRIGPGAPTLVVFLCLLYTSPSPRDQRGSRMPSSA